jgi:hypothetical protein
MGNAVLLQTQNNEVLLTVRQSGMNPLEFELVEHSNVRLIHKPSKILFIFGENVATFSPGAEAQYQTIANLNWAGKISMLEICLGYLMRVIHAPDLWASLPQENELLSIDPAEAVNTPFTADEQVQIKKTIEEIRAYITSTYTISSEPLAKVNRKLDYLIDASRRVGRIDWKTIFVGALVGLVLERLIPAGSGFQQLIGIAGYLLRHVFGNVISPPLLH